MIPYGKQHISDPDIQAVIDVLKSEFLTTGPNVEVFERKVAQYCGAKHGIAVSNGTAALHVAALALGIGEGHHGITSPNTFVASANCLAYCRAEPDFADIDHEIYCVDPSELERRITSRTKVLIPVHFAGHPCDMKAIWEIAEKHHLFVIEDAAHALGSAYQDKTGDWVKVGSCTHSHLTTFSFHPVKTITTGEGGMIMTNDDELDRKCRLIRNHGIERESSLFKGIPLKGGSDEPWYYEMQDLGFNYRLTDIQCALGSNQMNRLDEIIEKRRSLWRKYNQALKDIDKLTVPAERDWAFSAWHLYVATTVHRNDLLKELRQSGIGAHAMYIPVHLQPWYRRNFGFKAGDFPVSESYFDKCLVLPLHPDITEDEQEFIIESVKQFFRKI
ncbi:MAG: UDP-4-amino-4,6-dideoxy-N-acetyl-beta-L-altrosamine transaminase [Proteobacteria bacterium]|nr:UDP-4-amino-4,6-dideoxy-N-acetyl-beta-L-altrosamine transaminase [Pseudomonadota bacterium]